MHIDTVIVVLFVVTAVVAIAARRFRVPYTVALVIGGLLLGALHALEPPHLTKALALLFSLFLPGLIFEAAFHSEPVPANAASMPVPHARVQQRLIGVDGDRQGITFCLFVIYTCLTG